MEEKRKKKASLWISFLWTLIGNIALLVLLIYYANKFKQSHFKDFEALMVACFPIGVWIIALFSPSMKKEKGLYGKYKELRDAYCDYENTYVQNSIEEEKTFVDMYRAETKKRKILITVFVIFVCALAYFSNWYIENMNPYKNLINRDSLSWTTIYSLIIIAIYIVCMIIYTKVSSRKQALLADVYGSLTDSEKTELNRIKIYENDFKHAFTKYYLINWSGSLQIIELAKISEIRYEKYFYLVLYGTRLVIKDNGGKKYRIYSSGPSSKDWETVGLGDKITRGNKNSEVKEHIVHKY